MVLAAGVAAFLTSCSQPTEKAGEGDPRDSAGGSGKTAGDHYGQHG